MITLSSSLPANGVYFTFGRQQKAPGGVANGLGVWTKASIGVTMTGTNVTTWEDQAPSQRVAQSKYQCAYMEQFCDEL